MKPTPSVPRRLPHRLRGRLACLVLALGAANLLGCQTFSGTAGSSAWPFAAAEPVSSEIDPNAIPYTDQSSSGFPAQLERTANRVTAFAIGREPPNKERAYELYRQAEAVFKAAADKPRGSAVDEFVKAGDLFSRAAEAHPESALEQDALVMAGESYFFGDRLTDAEEAFTLLQKRHQRSRHHDRAAARLFEISQYWIETEKAGNNGWLPVNFFDPKRPFSDPDGHAIRVLDNIRYNDPTGVLSDDATMAAGVEKMRQKRYQEADEFFTDLRETFPDSEHQFNAHLLGMRCKLLVYAGPSYSGVMIDEAEKLLKQTRRRFPDRLSDEALSQELAKIAAEIDFRQAEKLVHRARYRNRRKEYGAARFYYQEILEKHPGTPFADEAREKLAAIAELPELPRRRLAWLAELFPEEREQKPLFIDDGDSMLR